MSPDRLRSFKGFEDIGEREAQQTIETLEAFCTIVIKHISNGV